MTTTVINLFGGPGCGKSTLSAELYYRMKRKHLKVELVREYVKDWAWENRKVGALDQLHLTGQQSRREALLYGKVDYIITDSPVLLSGFYQQKYTGETYVTPAILGYMKHAEKAQDVWFLNLVLTRHKPYQTEGRYETAEQAREIDREIKDYLSWNHVTYHNMIMADEEKAAWILNLLGA